MTPQIYFDISATRTKQDPEWLLTYRFAEGACAVEPHAIDYTEQARTGVLGDGCSAHYTPSPETEAMLIFGMVDRLLAKLTDHHRHVLTLAYGPAGQIATNGGQLPSKRWRAVACATPSVAQWAKAWADHRANRHEHGALAERYIVHLEDKMRDPKSNLSREERRRWEVLRTEAIQLLKGALIVWGALCKEK
jgi:hypothetical protein